LSTKLCNSAAIHCCKQDLHPIEMRSPLIAQVTGEQSGRLKGKTAVTAYWKRALALVPDLCFRFKTCFIGVDSIVIHYETSLGRQAAETFFFNTQKLVSCASAHYA